VFWRLTKVFPNNRFVIAPHGIDPRIFYPSGASPVAERPFRFLYVGTTLSRKGFDLLIDSFANEVSSMPNAELWLKISPTFFGFDASRTLPEIPGLRIIRERMTANGMADLYRSADLLVAPSRAEAFCLPVLEAMACGTPVLVPDGSAMCEYCPPAARLTVEADRVISGTTMLPGLDFRDPKPQTVVASG
jgi:glycosyltransferase involved in cell wall biosynthesis